MKKNMVPLMILLLLIPLALLNVNAEVLIQIEDNDSWIYDVQDSSTEAISFEVDGFDYFGDDEDLIRVNKIVTNATLENYKLTSLLSGPLYVNISENPIIGSADLSISLEEIISDEIWHTARGNLPYERTTVANSTLSFTDISYNNTVYPDIEHNAMLTFHDSMTNPTIIEPLSTGIVKLNHRILTITGVIENIDFLDFGLVVSDVDVLIIIDVEERYEASDLFTYMDTDCRNLTIRPLSVNMNEARFSDVEQMYFGFGFSGIYEVPVDALGPVEDWIFAFDAGLPLLVTETSQTPAPESKNVFGGASADTLRVMKLVDLSLVNSNFKIPTTT